MAFRASVSRYGIILFVMSLFITGCGGSKTHDSMVMTSDFEGSWSGEYSTNLVQNRIFTMDLVQQGTTLTGELHSTVFVGNLSGTVSNNEASLNLVLNGNGRRGTIKLLMKINGPTIIISSIAGSDNNGYHQTGSGSCCKELGLAPGEMGSLRGLWTGRVLLYTENTPANGEQSAEIIFSSKGDGTYFGQLISQNITGDLTLRKNGDNWEASLIEGSIGLHEGTFSSNGEILINIQNDKCDYIQINLEGTRQSTGSEKVTCLIKLINYDPIRVLEGKWISPIKDELAFPPLPTAFGLLKVLPEDSNVVMGLLSLERVDDYTLTGFYNLRLLLYGNMTNLSVPIEVKYTGDMFNLGTGEGGGFLMNITQIGSIVSSGPVVIHEIGISSTFLGNNPPRLNILLNITSNLDQDIVMTQFLKYTDDSIDNK